MWYTGQFYALFFLTITLKLDYVTAYALIGLSLVIGTPFFSCSAGCRTASDGSRSSWPGA